MRAKIKSKEADYNSYIFAKSMPPVFLHSFSFFSLQVGGCCVFSSPLNYSWDSAVLSVWIWGSRKLLCINAYWTWPDDPLSCRRWLTAFIRDLDWPNYCNSERSSSVVRVLVYICFFILGPQQWRGTAVQHFPGILCHPCRTRTSKVQIFCKLLASFQPVYVISEVHSAANCTGSCSVGFFYLCNARWCEFEFKSLISSDLP